MTEGRNGWWGGLTPGPSPKERGECPAVTIAKGSGSLVGQVGYGSLG